jgi:hypothetical protein
MKKYLIIILLAMFTMPYAQAQSLNFSTKYIDAGNNGTAKEEYSFSFVNGWLTKTDLSNNRSDKYPSYNDDSFNDKDGNYSMFFTPKQYANIDAVDFLTKCQDDMRAYRVVLDRQGGNVLYLKELKNRYNTETEKYYITELGKQLF